jgi:hypothetical protein
VELGFLIMTKGGVIIDIIYILIYFEVSRSSRLFHGAGLYVLIIYCKTKIRYKIKEEEEDDDGATKKKLLCLLFPNSSPLF